MKISNNRYELTFVEKGGEIYSFLDKETNIQYMYQGDAPQWTGKNPSLFPIVGNTYNGKYVTKGKEYAFKNHGVIRTSDLTCINNTDNSITFELKSNEDTLSVYPYAFVYQITYTLNDNVLTVSYDIENKDDSAMPFGFGLHPGFRVPLCEDEKYEDYTMTLEKEEHVKQYYFDPAFEKPLEKVDIDMQQIPMDYETINKFATLIYEGIQSEYVTLQGKKGHGVKVSLQPFPILAVWNKMDAPYICIEPWMSHADFDVLDIPFEEREGTKILQPNEHFKVSYTIEVF